MTTKLEEYQAKRKALEALSLTKEEKDRWSQMMHETWSAIAPDLNDPEMLPPRGYYKPSEIVEIVCDANRMMMFGGMTKEEDAFLSAVYFRPSFQSWARKEMNY